MGDAGEQNLREVGGVPTFWETFEFIFWTKFCAKGSGNLEGVCYK